MRNVMILAGLLLAATAFSDALDVDTDGDTIPDVMDNCTQAANPTQLDADGDGYGNHCDADLNNSGHVTVADFMLLLPLLGSADPVADLNGSGLVTVADYTILRNSIGRIPGPSALRTP